MNPWDFVTWLSAFLLAASALGIFVFFLRDAGSILNREMHGHEGEGEGEDEGENDSSSGSAPGTGQSSAPRD